MFDCRSLVAALCLCPSPSPSLDSAVPDLPAVPVERVGVLVPPPAAISAAHRFGVAVATNAHRLVIGADGRRDGRPDAGTVAVYRRDAGPSTRWRLERLIQAPTPVAGDRFGASLALDGERLVIGAPGSDADRGAAWIIDLDEPEAMPSRLPAPDDLNAGDQAGESVSIGSGIVAIGAPRADVAGRLDRGRVWCVTLAGPGLGDVAGPPLELEPPTTITGLRFGAAISIGASIAVGAPGADIPLDPFDPATIVDRAGEIVLFEIATPHARLGVRRRTSPGPLDRTGTAVAWCSDRLVAGSPRADCGLGRGGVVTTFGRVPSETTLPCRTDGGIGSRLATSVDRLATGIPGRRDDDGRLDAGVLLGAMTAAGVDPVLEIENLGAGAIIDVAIDPDGRRLAIAVARDQDDESRPGLVWLVELAPAPAAAVAVPSPDA